MPNRSAVDVAQSFLDALWADVAPNDAQLAVSLDCLLAASHDVARAEGVSCEVDPPEDDYSELCEKIANRFPGYGYYSVANPLTVGDASLMTGDAIDDLADLTRDLRQVVWRGKHFGANEAAWYFRLMYEAHWGRHARELALFLHARLTLSAE
jgi:hypothetical protein